KPHTADPYRQAPPRSRFPSHSARVETISAHPPTRVDPPFEGSHCQLATDRQRLPVGIRIRFVGKRRKAPDRAAPLHRTAHCSTVLDGLSTTTAGDDSTVSGSLERGFNQMPLDTSVTVFDVHRMFPITPPPAA